MWFDLVDLWRDDDLVFAFFSGMGKLVRQIESTPEDLARLHAGAVKLTSHHFDVDESLQCRWVTLLETNYLLCNVPDMFLVLDSQRGAVGAGLMEAFPGWRERILGALRLGGPVGPWPSVAHVWRSFHDRVLTRAYTVMWSHWVFYSELLPRKWFEDMYMEHVTRPVKVEAARLCRDIALLRKVVNEGSFEVVDEKSKETPKAMKWVAIPGGVADAFWEWDRKSMKPVVEVIDLSMDID